MRYSEIKQLFEVLGTKENVQAAIASINNHLARYDEIVNNYASYHGGEYYGEDYMYCEYIDSYEWNEDVIYDDTDDLCYLYSDCNCVNYYSNEARYIYTGNCNGNNDIYRYDGEYYHISSFDYNNLMFDDNGDVINCDDYESEDEYVSEYHSERRTENNLGLKNVKFKIGFEIEKEDSEVLQSICLGDFYYECEGWVKEKDGSLDSESGFELVSPILPLNVNKIKEYIQENKVLLNHINANKSNNCGGHINVSEVGKTGEQLFDEVKGFTPLFYALYYMRIDKNYSKGKSNEDLKKDVSKYQAITIHDNRIEYRIISAVPNFETLIWRTKLIDLVMKNKESDPVKAYYTTQTKFKAHLKKMYPKDKYNELMTRYENFIMQFENKTI